MRKETVRKAAADRSAGTSPGGKSISARGMTTKGSSGRPKASPPGSPRGQTRENKTTSTNRPAAVPKSFLEKLGEMHTAEKELTRALPLVQKAAKSKDLKTLLKIHLKETLGHVKALEAVAESLGQKLPSKSCKPMTKLIGEGVKVIAKRLVSGEKDQELIGVGHRIEQFEIENYTPLMLEADRLEFTHEHAMLTSILVQEKLASELLHALGEGKGPLHKLVKKAIHQHAAAGTAWADAA